MLAGLVGNSVGTVCLVSNGDNTFISAVLVNAALVPSVYMIVNLSVLRNQQLCLGTHSARPLKCMLKCD